MRQVCFYRMVDYELRYLAALSYVNAAGAIENQCDSLAASLRVRR